MPIIWSEYNASYKNEPEVTDADFMGPWLADTIRQCDGLVSMMSYWTFSDVFEEQGVVKEPFYGGFGLIAEDGLPKPSFNAFKLLHRLGNTRIAVDSKSALVTRREDGTIVMAVWNLFLPEAIGEAKRAVITIKGSGRNHRATVYRLDSTHGSLAARLRSHGQTGLSNASSNSGASERGESSSAGKGTHPTRSAYDRFAAARVGPDRIPLIRLLIELSGKAAV